MESLGVHVICGVVLLTPVVAHDASVSNVVLAAGVSIPVIATDVGNCRGLIYGEGDNFGQAGILTHIMNVEEIKDAIVYLAQHPDVCRQYGENGYKRFMSKYTIQDMKNTYADIYKELSTVKER